MILIQPAIYMKRVKLNLYSSHHIKINSICINDLNQRKSRRLYVQSRNESIVLTKTNQKQCMIVIGSYEMKKPQYGER